MSSITLKIALFHLLVIDCFMSFYFCSISSKLNILSAFQRQILVPSFPLFLYPYIGTQHTLQILQPPTLSSILASLVLCFLGHALYTAILLCFSLYRVHWPLLLLYLLWCYYIFCFFSLPSFLYFNI